MAAKDIFSACSGRACLGAGQGESDGGLPDGRDSKPALEASKASWGTALMTFGTICVGFGIAYVEGHQFVGELFSESPRPEASPC